ncbi:hypothetical protein PINS_up005097 [Pythium insidiosum]|nr:hypothetical protein PINS_up005097 [Pythium insidiosum]
MPGLVYRMRAGTYNMSVSCAITSGSIRALEMLHERNGGAYGFRSFKANIRCFFLSRNVEVVRWMLQRFATPHIGPVLWRDVLSQTPCEVALLETLYEFFPNVRVRDVKVNDIAIIQWLLEHGIDFEVSNHLLREAAERGADALAQRRIEGDQIQDYSPGLVAAVAASKWSIYFQLSEHYTKLRQHNQVLTVLAGAEVDRDHSLVQTLRQLLLQTAPNSADGGAIIDGLVETVRFLNNKNQFSANVVDEAAASGQVEVLKFLLAQDVFTCTETGLYSAASNGHVNVVRFLVERGIDANIDTALDIALHTQQKEVVAYLLPLTPQGCDRARWSTLLKLGFVTEWKDLVSRFPPSDLELELAEAMRVAGSHGLLSVIRFIHCELARPDLAVNAMEEAATVGHAGWITAVYNLTRQAPTLLTLKNAVMAASSYASWMPPKQERLEALSRLVRWCDCAATRDEVLKHATQHCHAEVAQVIEASMATGSDAQIAVGTIGLLDKLGNVEDWVVEAIMAPGTKHRLKLQGPSAWFKHKEEEPENLDRWRVGVQSLPTQAIERGDLATLQQLYRAMLNDPSLSEVLGLRFTYVISWAIASGNVSIVQWVLSTVFPKYAQKENILEHAISSGHIEVANWLLSTYPQSCQLRMHSRFRLCPYGGCTPAILEWLDRVAAHDSHLQKFLSWTGIVDDIVVQGDVALLQYVIKHHPEALESIDNLLLVAASHGHTKILGVLFELPAAGDVDTATVHNAAREATRRHHADVLQCLLDRYPRVDYSCIASEAARFAHSDAQYFSPRSWYHRSC